jgi:hypothetical protein
VAEPLTTTLAQVVDDAISRGVEFHMDDPRNTSVVMVRIPRGYSSRDNQRLKELRAPIRMIVKLRALSTWLNVDAAAAMHGDTATTDEEFAKWLDVFAGGDRLMRHLYSFDDCIWGAKGCAAATGHAVALCETCGSEDAT